MEGDDQAVPVGLVECLFPSFAVSSPGGTLSQLTVILFSKLICL